MSLVAGDAIPTLLLTDLLAFAMPMTKRKNGSGYMVAMGSSQGQCRDMKGSRDGFGGTPQHHSNANQNFLPVAMDMDHPKYRVKLEIFNKN